MIGAELLLAGLLAGAPAERIVTLGAAVTETAAALGAADRIVAVDTTSRWPETLADRPRVGYLRTLPAEGLLALRPQLVVGTEAAGPSATLEAVRGAGVRVELVKEAKTWPEAQERLRAVGRILGHGGEAEVLADEVGAALEALGARLEGRPKPRVLFVFAHGREPVVAGEGTVADTMIRLAGGENALTEVEGHRQLSAEAVVSAAPEVILTTTRVLDGLGGPAGLARLPGVGATPAARDGRIVALDGALLLALGPRTAEAARALAEKLHPEALGR